MKFTVNMLIEGLNAYQVVDKLAREDIAVYAVVPKKNAISVQVARKDCKKVFAILRSSCYNVKKVYPSGWTRFMVWGKRSAGLLCGTLLASICVCCLQLRILQVDVVGSGKYYEREIQAVLQANGIVRFGKMPQDTSPISAYILSLPRVSFCKIEKNGGVVTVEVQVDDETEIISSNVLQASASGEVVSLVVIRGTPLVAVGDEVSVGQTIVDRFVWNGERKSTVIVVAYAKIACSISEYYCGNKQQALAQAYLEYGEITALEVLQENEGYRITGTVYYECVCNMD